MKESLVEFTELMRLLGYEDERSAKKWCKANHIPIIKTGKNRHVLSQFLTQHIENQLVIFAQANSLNPSEIIQKSKEENISEEKKINSKASEMFLKNIRRKK